MINAEFCVTEEKKTQNFFWRKVFFFLDAHWINFPLLPECKTPVFFNLLLQNTVF